MAVIADFPAYPWWAAALCSADLHTGLISGPVMHAGLQDNNARDFFTGALTGCLNGALFVIPGAEEALGNFLGEFLLFVHSIKTGQFTR